MTDQFYDYVHAYRGVEQPYSKKEVDKRNEKEETKNRKEKLKEEVKEQVKAKREKDEYDQLMAAERQR